LGKFNKEKNMRTFQLLSSLVILASLLVSACAPAASTPDAMMEKPTEVMMEESATPDAMMSNETPTTDAMSDATNTEAMMESPAWFGAALTDAASGQTFTINDFKGKVVLVETMAQWCSSCRKQQGEVKTLHEKLGMNEDLVTIGLDIDPNENLEDLKSYVANDGIDWYYAVTSVVVTREIAKLYGNQFLNPPSTPMLIIDRQGVAHPLPFGIKSADQLLESVNMYLSEGM